MSLAQSKGSTVVAIFRFTAKKGLRFTFWVTSHKTTEVETTYNV